MFSRVRGALFSAAPACISSTSGTPPIGIEEQLLPWLAIHGAFKRFEVIPEGRLLILASSKTPSFFGEARGYPKGSVRADLQNFRAGQVQSARWQDRTQDVLLDNTKSLPFRDQAFVAAYMGLGICTCPSAPSGAMCCGVPLTAKAITTFLSELSRVIDWSDPKAQVVLTGQHHSGDDQGHVDLWAQALAATRFAHPVKVALIREKALDWRQERALQAGQAIERGFNGVIITRA